MTASARAAPPNSLVLIGDTSDWVLPESMGQSLISATDSCVAVGCRAADDGETEFVLGSAREVDPGEPPAFEAVLRTPSRRIAVCSVLGESILDAGVDGQRTRVRVWLNDPVEPDRIIVGFA